MNGFPGGAGGVPSGAQFVFSSKCSGMDGMSNARAEDVFRAFFGSGDPIAGMGGFGDDGLSDLLRGMRPGGLNRRAGNQRRVGKRKRANILPVGTCVRLAGLVNAKLNDARGQVVEFDEEKHRYKIMLQGQAVPVTVKPSNLEQVLNGVAVINTSRSDLNGRASTQAFFDRRRGRYMLDGVGQGTVALRPENVMLPVSTRVTIDGMQNRTDLNGMCGKIIAADEQRYTVQLQTGEQVRLRIDTVTA
jgi:hypothetical protein